MKRNKMMKAGMLVILVMLYGCGGGQALKPTSIATPSADEKLIWSSEPKRPGWTLEEPETVNGVMSFVGLSGFYGTEKSGRDDARRNAIKNVIQYLGTLAKDKFEKASISFGLDSNIIDPTESVRAIEKQLAVNMTKQVKNKKWYIEKWQKPTGAGYQVFLLAQVPQSVVDKTLKNTIRGLAKKAEQQAKEAGNEIAKKQAENAAEFWKQMEKQGLIE